MKEVKGNLISLACDGEFDIIAHGCNCHHTMRSGIAGQLVNQFPQVLEVDKELTEYGDPSKLGTTTGTRIDEFGFYVFNCYTQFNYGRDGRKYVEYGAVRSCMKEIASHVEKDKRIGLPLIGAGLAGGDWEIIKKIIADELYEHDVTIVHFDK